jgi:predicted aspartyl protease
MKKFRLLSIIVAIGCMPIALKAQTVINVLDQNITVMADDEPLTEVVKKICQQFNLDFDYNSQLIKGKRVNLSLTNKTLSEVLKKLMDDFYLIFEIQNNVLVVRDYVPLSKKIEYDELYNQPSEGFLFDNPNRKSMTFDFKLISNLIVIPVSINGSDTMNFILDTGVRDPIITELTLVEELNLKYLNPIQLKGLGNETVTQAYQSGDNTITLPGLSVSKQKINVVIDENFQISQILGMPVHGLIGMNLFRHYVVRVDYHDQTITLIKPQFFEYKPRKNDMVLPVHFIRNKPIVRAEVFQDSAQIIPVLLLVDTGASDALWLSINSNDKFKIPVPNLYSFLGMGIGGELYGHKARIDGLWLGGKVLEKPIASYPQSEMIDQIVMKETRHGSMGGEILRRFTLTFDYFNNRIIFRPNNDFSERFTYNLSGLEILNPVPGVPVYTINNVIENSPAWEAGVRKNDQILWVNGRNHRDMTLNDINLMIRQRENKRIRLTLLRNGEEIKSSFKLEETFEKQHC